MTSAPLFCALALMAGPTSTGTAATDTGKTRGAFWLNSGGLLVTAIGGGNTIIVPFGVSVPLPEFPTLSFELTYFRWSCLGSANCTVSFEQGVFATGGFHFDTEGKGPLAGFFISPKVQLSGFQRTFLSQSSFDGLTFGAELGLDLGYQWHLGPFYLALMLGASGGVAIHSPSGLYGLLVQWNGSSDSITALLPRPVTWVFGINANVLRAGFTF